MPKDNALEFVKEYVEKMYQADLHQREKRKEIARQRSVSAEENHRILKEALDIARKAYKEFWDPKDDEWYPISIGWPSNYDLSAYSNWRTLAAEENVIVSADGPELTSTSKHVYYLRREGKSFKIFNFVQE